MKFSVITPNFNSGDKLLRAHQSLLSNECAYEHIVIDDLSSDSSMDKLLNSTTKNIVSIKLENNFGPGNARNIGLSLARGEYVLFLDADDYLEENTLDDILTIIEDNHFPDLVIFDYYILVDKEPRVGMNNGLSYSIGNDELISSYMKDEVISSPWCKCIKSEIAKSHSFPNLRVQQDSLYNFNVFMETKKIVFCEKKFYNFDKTFLGSLTTKPFNRKEMLKFYKSWFFFKRLVLESNIKDKERLLAIREIRFCCYYYINRLADNGENIPDSFVIGVIKKKYIENFLKAYKYLSLTGLCFGFLFLVSPNFMIKILRKIK